VARVGGKGSNVRFFNTAGPVHSADHYCIPPLSRLNLEDILGLIAQKKYFVFHAPRQAGKTSYLLALMDYINQHGQYRCVYVNVEVAQTARDDVARGMQAILGELSTMARDYLHDDFLETIWPSVLEQRGGDAALGEVLTRWSQSSALPLVLFIDEIDALVGDTLIAVLRQLRAGYPKRPQRFPQSVILCGVRDVRDYRIHTSHTQDPITGGSAFNIKAETFRIEDFSAADIGALYQQHSAETGQDFAPGVVELVWELTQGQPWLVNALGYEVCFRMPAGRNRTQPITVALLEEAKERLILRRETHLDQLADKLQEERVRAVLEPILTGEIPPGQVSENDLHYVADLGLITTHGQLRIANPIYREVIPRALTYTTQLMISHDTVWYLRQADRQLDMPQLLAAFQQFFREQAESWVERFHYKEAGPQLLLQAFLQRIVNGGGRVEREYGLGRRRTDLLILWPYNGGIQRVVIETKLRRGDLANLIQQGVAQTWGYMDRCGASEGHLMLFDRRPEISWEDKLFHCEESYQDKTIHVWGV